MFDLKVIPYYLLNFVVLLVLLRFLLYKPVSKFLTQRRERIAAQLSDAEKAKAGAQQLLKDAQTQFQQSRNQADQALSDARSQAQAYAAEILADWSIAKVENKQDKEASLASSMADYLNIRL